MTQRLRSKRGFTLIEVLVAISILGIGLTVILQLFSGGLKSAKISEEYTKALWYGKSKMEEMIATKDFSEGEKEGTIDNYYSWKSEVKMANPTLGLKEEEAKFPVDLYRIVVKITWTSGAGQRTLEIESLRLFKTEDLTGEKT